MDHFSRAVKLKKKYLSTCSLFFKLMWYQCFRLQTRNFLKGTHRSHLRAFVGDLNHCFKSLFNQILLCVVYSLKIRIETLLYFKRELLWFDIDIDMIDIDITLILVNEMGKMDSHLEGLLSWDFMWILMKNCLKNIIL